MRKFAEMKRFVSAFFIMNKIELITTKDGSHSIYVPELNETYHSTNGAIREAELVFIQYGLLDRGLSEIELLEIGFGTGLNAFLTLTECSKKQIKVNYTGIELYPVAIDKALQLNYPEMIEDSERESFEQLHQLSWGETHQLTDYFSFTKLKADFIELEINQMFDVIYFDAFGPDKQPEMWQKELFNKLYRQAKNGAFITTYSAKGDVRRAMQAAGFTMEKLSGPPGKREVLRGRKE